LQAQILDKTEGVPLFLEELTKMVLESGLLREAGAGYEMAASLPPVAIPSTLEDSLLARLDRLAPVKEVAQIGAVIGREFSYQLLFATAQMDEPRLKAALDELVRAELAFCRGSAPDAAYIFKHALVRDAAYQCLLKSRRRQIHAQIATVLHERFPEKAQAEPELVAHHATEGGLLDQAVSYWHKAGLQASYRSATTEAIAHLSKALDVLGRLPETPSRDRREIELQIALGTPQIAAKGYGSAEALAAYARAHELCNKLGDETSQLFPALRGLWTNYRARGEMRMARDLADQLAAIARRSENQAVVLEAHHAQWTTQFCLGAWASVCEHTARGLAIYRPEHFANAFTYGGHDAAVCGTAKEGLSLWMLGFPDRALPRVEESVFLARKLDHPPSVLHALWLAIILHYFRGDAAATREATEARLQLAYQRMPDWLQFANLLMSLISALEGQQKARTGIASIREALAKRRAGDVEGTGFVLCLFGGVCGLAGEIEPGLIALEAGIAEAEATGAHIWESELHRMAGNLMLQSASAGVERSEGHYLRAIQVAREQRALSLELRASTLLAHLWAERGERQKAHDLLVPVYASFTEGFGTRDLSDAKALLDELR
jgi:predicted ATPase